AGEQPGFGARLLQHAAARQAALELAPGRGTHVLVSGRARYEQGRAALADLFHLRAAAGFDQRERHTASSAAGRRGGTPSRVHLAAIARQFRGALPGRALDVGAPVAGSATRWANCLVAWGSVPVKFANAADETGHAAPRKTLRV